jgi:hypothetical protein
MFVGRGSGRCLRSQRGDGAADGCNVHASCDAASREVGDEVLGGEVAGGTGGVGAAAQAAGGAVKDRDAVVEGGIDVGEGGAAGVVEVEGKAVDRDGR